MSFGLSQRKSGPHQKFLAFLFYSNSQGFWENPEGLFSLLLYKGIGAISLSQRNESIEKERYIMFFCN